MGRTFQSLVQDRDDLQGIQGLVECLDKVIASLASRLLIDYDNDRPLGRVLYFEFDLLVGVTGLTVIGGLFLNPFVALSD